MIEPTWVSVARTSVALEMDEQQIYRLIREKKFPFRYVRLGRLIRVSAADLGLLDSVQNNEAWKGDQSLTAAAPAHACGD